MKRNEWEFEYTASKVAVGAEAQAMFRKSRLEWWEAQKAQVMAEVRESGIEVSESIAAGYQNFSTEMLGPQVVVRHDLQRKLTECHKKIEGHQQRLAEYDGWVQVLRANPEQRLKLTSADWLYFFGKA